MDERVNSVRICGTAVAEQRYSHAARGEIYYTFPFRVERLSGAEDILNIVVRREGLIAVGSVNGKRFEINGEVRSFNNKSGVGSKLVITVLAAELLPTDDDDMNFVELTGTVCKPPTLRYTPMGREISDIMLAVNRRYGKSDYIPCIAWGRVAEKASEFEVGKRICVTGRLQSRKYIKLEQDVPIEKTAFEVSISGVGVPEDE